MTSYSDDRLKALFTAMESINKENGAGNIQMLGDAGTGVVAEPIGIPTVDRALGGGLAKGRIIEIYGPEASGKTSFALAAIAATQKRGDIAAIIDAEHALDPVWAAKFGVDIDNLVFSQPDTGEQALETLDKLISSGAVGLIVVDSVAALTPKAEIEGTMTDANVGIQARLMSKALRKITGPAARTGTTVIFINQLREKIGVFFGSPETTTGGKALKFYASQRIDIRRIETLKVTNEPVGTKSRVKVVKNKVAPPFKEATFELMYEYAFSLEGNIIDLAVEFGIFKKSGAWFTYPESENGNSMQIGQGKENSRQFLKDNPEVLKEVYDKLNALMFPKKDKKSILPVVEESEAAPDNDGE